MGALTAHLRHCRALGKKNIPASDDCPAWLLHFLATQNRENNWKLKAKDFERELDAGHCRIFLDGLDEAPDELLRKKMSTLAENLLKAYPDNKIVLTSRPAALTDDVIPGGFSLVDILPLDDAAMDSFLNHWCNALFSETPEKARQYRQELGDALSLRPDIHRMARTPVMLTALAVVHWNENRLPEQRFELYESVLTWLFRSRQERPGRLKADLCRNLLQKLALEMFIHPDGRQTQVSLVWAAEKLALEFKIADLRKACSQAEFFLRDEMIDSGIIVKEGNSLKFWHLSFQEYLAAFEIAGMVEENQEKFLFEHDHISSPEWRETFLLLAGILHKQGKEKINRLINCILKRIPQKETGDSLPGLAKHVALLGGIQNDLSFVEFKPENPDYDKIIKRVEGIFETKIFRQVAVQIRAQAADALALAGDPRFDAIQWIDIPGGEFFMGAQKSDKKGKNYDPDAEEKEWWKTIPVHKVKLSPLKMSTYPVTVAMYKKFIDANAYQEKEWWKHGGFGEKKAPDNWQDQLLHPARPVVYVSWYEASAFAAWSGGRLPTEAEWEFAARGEKYRIYPWGNNHPDVETCNFTKTGFNSASPVGIFPENVSPFGMVDMAGNVWEWCADWFDSHYYEECEKRGMVADPQGPNSGVGRVLRGGSFGNNNPDSLRCATRYLIYPDNYFWSWGFRLARPI